MSEQRLYTEEEHLVALDEHYKAGICNGIKKVSDYLMDRACKCLVSKNDEKAKEYRDLANSIGSMVDRLRDEWSKKGEVKNES